MIGIRSNRIDRSIRKNNATKQTKAKDESDERTDPLLSDEHLEQAPDQKAVVRVRGAGRIRAEHVRLMQALDLALDEEQRALGRRRADSERALEEKEAAKFFVYIFIFLKKI